MNNIFANKIFALAAIALCALCLSVPASATETKTEEERIEHYQPEQPQTTEEATALLRAKTEAIDGMITDEELDAVALEDIHEISYALEAAVDKLRADKADVAKLDQIDEAVQALHYASESQEEAKTREWFAKLKPMVMEMESTETASSEPSKKLEYQIVIKDHKFTPERITVPANEKIKLIVVNEDKTPEEFESHDFNREKIIAGNSKATIFVGPLKPGEYHYFGEFNMDTANGYIIAE